MRSALAIALVVAVALGGCLEIRNMQELKAAVGAVEEEAALPPLAPSAQALAFPTVARVGEVVLFSAAGSSDPEGAPLVYLWTFNDGDRADGPEARHAFSEAGAYLVEVTVSDPDGLWDVAQVEVVVLPSNFPPSAAIEARDARGLETLRTTVGQPLSFRAVASDPENGALAFAWDFGDGGVATEPAAKHAWTAPGRYTVALKVTDDAGLANRSAVEVRIDHRATHTGVLAAGDPAKRHAFPGGPAERLVATLAYDPGLASDLTVRVLDAEGALVAESRASAPGNETLDVPAADLARFAPGEWHAEVHRASGVRVEYALTVELRY